MEKEKYYTPTIEELNVNQEVYLLDTGNYKASYSEGDVYPMLVIITQLTDYPTVWVKTKGNEKGYKVYEVYPDQIGLKYLDREDIESFGFIYIPDDSVGDGDFRWYNHYKIDNFYLAEFVDKIIIRQSDDLRGAFNTSNTVFEGVIKNKSELKKLLVQLGIK